MRSLLHRVMYLNTSSPVGGIVLEGYRTIGGIALLEKALHWGKTLRVYILISFSSFGVYENVTS